MNEYATSAELKATLSLTGQTFADANITRSLTAASRAVDHICGQRFWVDADANQVRYYTPKLRDVLYIDPLATFTALLAAPAGLTFDDTWVRDTDFQLEPINAAADSKPFDAIRLKTGGSFAFPDYPNSIKLTGKFGWAAVPEAAKHATELIAARLLLIVRQAPYGVVGFNEQGAVRVSRDVPDLELVLGDLMRGPVLV